MKSGKNSERRTADEGQWSAENTDEHEQLAGKIDYRLQEEQDGFCAEHEYDAQWAE